MIIGGEKLKMEKVKDLLTIKAVVVETAASERPKKIITDVSLEVKRGETVVILGPNGAGKSTLGAAIMGDPRFRISKGEIKFLGEKINTLEIDKRGLLGMMMTMQNPVEITGISTTDVIRNALIARGEKLTLDQVRERISVACKKLKTNIFFAEREINVQFSGGEKKRNEILQALVLKPKLLILDEIDSGLDVDAAENISNLLKELQKETGAAYLIITHNMRVLKNLDVDRTYILKAGEIVKAGGVELMRQVEQSGFGSI